ncbi:MAG: glycoside hydrolase family 15 protein [Alphaproteobacteria bacterium]|nr:glycoside hydrolase family 15 protein [Alphaproteobacteria bacterium]MCD8570910.1 glycoside hydrolase family 15 protein [Alphaproteobacteria bacterium]
MPSPSSDLGSWIVLQKERSKNYLAAAVSANSLSHERSVFGQRVMPIEGSVLASPVSAHWNPEPDYFYHWTRDAAIVMENIIPLCKGMDGAAWRAHFQDYITFSLKTLAIDGKSFSPNPLTDKTPKNYLQYVRPAEELSKLNRDALMGEPRFNPDATPDLQKWARPQYDGPALRAMTCLHYLEETATEKWSLPKGLENLLMLDLDFTARHSGMPCIGPWEEDNEFSHHYFTGVVQLGALQKGSKWAAGNGYDNLATRCKDAAHILEASLDQHWSQEHRTYKAILEKPLINAEDGFDAAILMGVLHTGRENGRHSIHDERLHTTVQHMEDYFAKAYPVNHGHDTPVIGRSKSDQYFGNNPWFPTSLALTEYYYARGEITKGDKLLERLREVTPDDGSLSEQFDRANGNAVSARHLTWSYAAFLSAARAREEALTKQKPAVTPALDPGHPS